MDIKAAAVVKPLEWIDLEVNSPVGRYSIKQMQGNWRAFYSGWTLYTADKKPAVFGSLDDAKAAAQSDFERRILSAIDLSALEARVASAEGALRPFADFASLPGFDKLPEKVHVTNGSSLAARQITVGDLRAARAHFQSQGGDHGRD